MTRRSLLVGGAALVLLASAVAAAAIPGAIAQPREEREPPGRIDLQEMTVAPGPITGDTATLTVDAFLTHRGGTSANVSVVYRATDLESGMVETTERVALGNISKDGEHTSTANVTVEREGGYRLEVLLYQNGSRVATGAKEVRGVGTLTPAYARTSVRFHQFDRSGLPPVEFTVADVSNNRTTLDISAYLTNRGSATSGLTVVFKARQADSNIVAAEKRVEVGRIGPGRTAEPSTELVVPSGYNYYLDAVLWKDGVIVGTTRAAANLDPKRTISVNESVQDVGLEVSDFEKSGDGTGGVKPQTTARQTETQSPGLGIGTAIAALAGVALFSRRWLA